MDESISILFGLSCSEKNKMYTTIYLEKYGILKKCIKIYFSQNFKCLVISEVD